MHLMNVWVYQDLNSTVCYLKRDNKVLMINTAKRNVDL